MAYDTDAFLTELARRHPHQPEFHQAATELAESVADLVGEWSECQDTRVLDRIVEPERVVTFRIVWENDRGGIEVNRGFRVQFNSALGPYKGGLRFHPSVNLSVLKFLAFEQIFKNALTGLPLGGGKGGSDFDPKGRSDREVMRFCQAFMSELYRHIGADTDVPAGDIGVGAREVGYLFGQYRRLTNQWTGVLTGKDVAYGGSPLRPEATGYGVVYFTRNVLEHLGRELASMVCTVSGSGNVAQYCVAQLLRQGAKVVTLSDSDGFVHDSEGIDEEKLAWVQELKNVRRGRIREYAEHFSSATFHEGARPWVVPCHWAFPCATENELDRDDAAKLLENGCHGISEGANMPTEAEAIQLVREAGKLIAPGKAANAGGVAVSGLEMSQNSLRLRWSPEEVDERLQEIMRTIHDQCVSEGEQDGHVDYVRGANVAGFRRVATAMLAQGLF